jgi:hypothetical protein
MITELRGWKTMQGNDISSFSPLAQAVIFEGLLASPPEGAKALLEQVQRRRGNWEGVLRSWTPHELPLKALSDSVNRLGLGTDVYTFLHEDAVSSIDNWLTRKGISTPVYYYPSVELLEYDLRFQRAIRTVYVANEEHAKVLGIRTTVVSPDRAWAP